MSAPLAFPDWDTNLTNLAAPVAGHVTDGYANSEVPASNETNGQLNLIGQWVRFLSSLREGRFRWRAAGGGLLVAGATIDNTSGGVMANGALSGFGFIQLDVAVGDIITDLGVTSLGDGVHDLLISLVELDGAGAATTKGTVSRVAQAASWSKATNAITPYTVVDGKSVHIGGLWTAGTTQIVQAVGWSSYSP